MDRDAILAAMMFGGSGSGGGGGADAPLVVTFSQSGSTWSCDTSGDDIKAAVAAGKSVYGIYNNMYVFQLTLCTKNSNAIEFSTVKSLDAPAKTVVWTLCGMKMASVWIWLSSERPLPPVIANGDDGKILSVTSSAQGTVGWAVDKGEPYEVIFSITGQPSGTSYPVIANRTIAEITAAAAAGARVYGWVALSANQIALGALSGYAVDANDEVIAWAFDLLGLNGSTVILGHAQINALGGGSEQATLHIIPLSTAQMTYDSGTQTLAIVDPLA